MSHFRATFQYHEYEKLAMQINTYYVCSFFPRFDGNIWFHIYFVKVLWFLNKIKTNVNIAIWRENFNFLWFSSIFGGIQMFNVPFSSSSSEELEDVSVEKSESAKGKKGNESQGKFCKDSLTIFTFSVMQNDIHSKLWKRHGVFLVYPIRIQFS